MEMPLTSNMKYNDAGLDDHSSGQVDMQTIDSDRPFRCKEPNCSRRYLSRHAMSTHWRVFHLGQRPYRCNVPKCDKAFASPAELRRHAVVHKQDESQNLSDTALDLHIRKMYLERNPHECNEPGCDRAFPSPAGLEKHTEKHKLLGSIPRFWRQGKRTYQCIVCGLSFDNDRNRKLKSHMRLYGIKNFLCSSDWAKEIIVTERASECGLFFCHEVGCGLSFKTADELEKHMRAHSQSPFSCRNCGRTFSRYTASACNHETSCFLNGKFACLEPGCSREFSTKAALKNHMTSHSSEDNLICKTIKPYLCSQCGHGCPNRESLQLHMNSHLGIRPFVCDYFGCEKSFTSRSGRNVHRKKHKSVSGFPCTWPGCERRPGSLGGLKNHVRIHTGERPFACTYEGCQMAFRVVSARTNHINVVHLHQKRFTCDFPSCGRQFGAAYNLRAHSRIHEK